MFKFARKTTFKEIKIIIVIDNDADHLFEMIVTIMTLSIIEIPIKGKILDGNDSLLSIV